MSNKTSAKTTPFTLTTAQVERIRACFGGSIIKDGADLCDRLERSMQVRFSDEIVVPLSVEDLWSLKQQSVGMSTEYDKYVKDFIAEAIQYQLNGFFVPRSR